MFAHRQAFDDVWLPLVQKKFLTANFHFDFVIIAQIAIHQIEVEHDPAGIFTEVSAAVTIRCGANETHIITPDPDRESGTGFIIHPDGWIATNVA